MRNRDAVLSDLRPDIPSAKVLPGMTPEEQFQNNTLRPIAKLQDQLLVAVFRNYARKRELSGSELEQLPVRIKVSVEYYVNDAANSDNDARGELV